MTRELTHSRVAGEVTARLLGGQPECEIDWAGRVDLPLTGERAVQAACGIAHVHGRATAVPRPLAVDYACTVAGVLAAHGSLAARLARLRGRPVGGVRTSVAEAALLSVGQYLAAATAEDDWVEPLEAGSPVLSSADGVGFEIETLYAEPWQAWWTELGVPARIQGRAWPPFQRRFGTATCALPEELHRAAAGREFAALADIAERAGVGIMPIRQTPDHPSNTPRWTLDAMGEPAEAPGSPSRANAVSETDAPLDGLVIVESTRRVQGPIAGHVLRMLGAEVIRIEPPGGDPMRGIPPMSGDCSARFRALNAGKRVVEIDIKTEPGRVHELVCSADAFVHNWAPGKATELGLEAADLIRTSPGLVYAWASGWGSEFADPPLGTDYLVQAHSGLGAALRPANEPAAPSLMTLTDVLGGLLCAHAVLAGLLHRHATGSGVRVESSLYGAAGIIPRPARRTPWAGHDRALRTADGYLFVDAEPPLECAELTTADATAKLATLGITATPVCTDLADLATDPAFGRVITRGAHAYPRPPWEFGS